MTYAYGLGIGSHRGLKTVSHGGSWVGFKSHMVRFPTQRFTVVIFANVKEFTPGYLAIKIAELYLENDFTEKKKEISSEKPVEVPPVIELPSEVLKKYCGFYYNQKMNAFIEITEEAKQLKLDFNKGMIYFLAAPIGEQKFLSVKDSPSSLSFLPKGENKWELKALMPGIPVELCFQQVTLYSYTPEKFKDYMGSYHCPSLNSHYEITKEGEELVFNIQHQHFQLMRTPEKDQFIIQAFGVQVTFLRPSQHKVEKIQLDAQRSKKIELIRV